VVGSSSSIDPKTTGQPTLVAAPVQTEHSDNERRGRDDHLNDDENNAVEDDP
nr:hypothetical protein [Tanacetum cinerariifolium]